MATNQSQEAWSDFWALNSQGTSGDSSGGGCLPQRWAAIEQAQKEAWFGFCADLPDKAKVLDLATGDGRVLRWMLSKRSDLQLLGIDLAPKLPLPPAGTETRGGIAMESLPFDDGRFNAVTSQFGFEYGDTQRVANEIARVLASGGRVGLMVHRGDGPILEHNRQRRNELLWALKEKGVARKVKAALKGGASGIDRAAKLAGKVATQGAAKFGETSPAWEIPEAIRRSCLMGRQAGVGSITETIGIIEGHAKNELGRIKSLAGACTTADARDKVAEAFAKHGLTLNETLAIREPTGRELADFITFS
ncbi:methyltransferase domain-containing protein [Erythrobacter sp. Alg231-14]|uniref:methyltransferase domain-containing protein n=1 Tax=Erythrobacter sp. Alg231-14 TaxID=1922225 RepID=UPI000D54C0E4